MPKKIASMDDRERWMRRALAQARRAAERGEVPVGAVIVQNGRVIASGHNLTKTRRDPTLHAEIVALRRAASRIKNERLNGCALFVTLEPCAMCAGAVVQARLADVVYGARDPKAGACGSVLRVIPNQKLNHRPSVVGGVLAEESVALLKGFFQARRMK